jgi:hypothetical protein
MSTEAESQLGVVERGFALAAVRALGARAEGVCGRRSSALRRQAATLLRDSAAQRREIELLGRDEPLGLAEIDPSWYEAPPSSISPGARAWMARRAYGRLVDMPPPPGGARDLLGLRLEREDPARLETLLMSLGQRRVAIAFSGAPRAALAQLCARLGEPAASELLGLVRQVAAQISSDEVRAAQRALFTLEGDTPVVEDADWRRLYLRAGCAWLGAALLQRGGDRLRRVAQRLPRPAGEVLLAAARQPATESEAAAATAAAVALLGRV